MSRLFLDGIDSKLSQYSKIELDDLHFNLKKRIKNKLSSVGTNRLITDIDTMIDECYNNYSEKLENYQNIVYQSPVKASISILPMNELSIMAETLVNLTSFKRQMSHNQQETVGGPTDVAIITKGDGFRWIKRKTL